MTPAGDGCQIGMSRHQCQYWYVYQLETAVTLSTALRMLALCTVQASCVFATQRRLGIGRDPSLAYMLCEMHGYRRRTALFCAIECVRRDTACEHTAAAEYYGVPYRIRIDIERCMHYTCIPFCC